MAYCLRTDRDEAETSVNVHSFRQSVQNRTFGRLGHLVHQA